jgi:hypothetical protein
MEIAYVDESGDSGYEGSQTYTLGCILIEDIRWPDALDIFDGFRRGLSKKFGIRVRDEIKADYLVRGSGPLKRLKLGDHQRRAIYLQHMRLARKLPVRAFGVVIHKGRIKRQATINPRDLAWDYLLQRIERYSTNENTPIIIMHDEGDSVNIRNLARKARRANSPGSAFGVGRLKLPARLLIDDPVSLQSHQSYFVQLADLVAYAAYRRHYPPPANRFAVCHESMWDELGTARYALAETIGGKITHQAIVSWPPNN